MRQGLSAVPLNSLLFLLPAILFVLLSIVFTLRYPLTLRRICKLERYLTLRQKGEENKPLRRQLESFILQKSYREFLYRVLIFVLRLLFPHRLCGRENLHFDPDIPCVFVCNHGEVYGPLITNIHIPYPFRTWTTSEMMEEKTISNYMKASSFVAGFPLPRRMKIWLIDHIFTQFDAWVMRVIEAIPVYHGSTRGLMNTFRATTDAMEAGDNILIFPEDSSTSESGVYAQEGVSDFFTGFVTIAQLFRSRTGKCCQFIPVYADKQRKRITFGTSVRYDPDAVGAEEKERICTALKNEINRIAFSPDPPKRRVFGKS
jgi:1-acyl-sn-glycerol-3-phosphate acyltransferase